MNPLVRLYPKVWRDRYGEEVAALLEDRPLGPFDVADLLHGALDAHLHLRGLGQRSERRTWISMSLRLAGSAAAIGGCAWALFFTIAGASYANAADYGSAWIPVVLIAGLGVLVALAGLSAPAFSDHPRLIWIAFLVPAMGIGVVFIGLTTLIPTGGWSTPEGSLAAQVIYGGISLMLIGSIVFAAVTVSTATLSRVATSAILVGVVATLPALFGMITAIWLVVGGIVFGLGWTGLGIDAIRRDRRPVPVGPAAA